MENHKELHLIVMSIQMDITTLKMEIILQLEATKLFSLFFNDFRDDHLSSDGEKLGFEFRAMAYENPQDEALQ